MIIRSATVDDLKPLAALFDKYRVFYEKQSDPEAAMQFLRERIGNEESIVFVAENADQKLAGFTQLYPQFSSTRLSRMWLLNDLFIDPKFRGLGISKLLLDKAKDHCRATDGCDLTLETQKDNIVANQLYIKTAFTLDTEHNFYSWQP